MISQITIPPLEPFDLDKGLNIISTNSLSVFFSFSQGIKGKNEMMHFYDDDNNRMEKLESEILLVGDIAGKFNYDEWFKKQLLSAYIREFDDEQLAALHKIHAQLFSVLDKTALDSMLPISLNQEFDTKNLVSIFKPTVDVPEYENFYDEIQAIIDIAGALSDKRMLVLFHISEYCTNDQLEYLVSDIKRQELQVLCLERTDHLLRFGDERSYYVDEDFVQFS
ncbi:type II-A CRISPR-associated protein Csn2 [Scardovia wiggsiae]|uniref:type II-A CRISPR-associated protein Csn2 n=1 Tax=Scardovia wiggsiae TaxID=230143 RepID=UPI00374E91C3